MFEAVAGPKAFVTFGKTGHESYITTQPAKWRRAVENIIRSAENHAIQGSSVSLGLARGRAGNVAEDAGEVQRIGEADFPGHFLDA